MTDLPWYLRRSPAIFLVVAAIKGFEAVFTAIGAKVWVVSHPASADIDLVVWAKVFDALIAAYAWVGTAIVCALLLAIFRRVSVDHA